MNNIFDTICAIITPIAYGAVGIIRISGCKSFEIAKKIFSRNFEENKIKVGYILDENNEKLDEAVLLAFKGPKSYTGEDVIEFQTHGNPVILNKVLELILNNGARLAERGEFTKRAFLNGRIDLTQAESVLDIIQSKSEKSVQSAMLGLSGHLKNEIETIKTNLKDLYSKIIASIDFPEDVKEVSKDEVKNTLDFSIEKIEKLINDSNSHNFIKDGVSVCLIGKPNVGKSSLFNALLNYSRAIVTSIAGTTRDSLKETLILEGYPVNFVDTAGIRDKNKADKVEKIGIENSIKEIEISNIILFLFENNIDEIDKSLIELAKGKKTMFIKTKSDIIKSSVIDKNVLEISSKTGFNIDTLKNKIVEYIKKMSPDDNIYFINKRQKDCLIKAKEAINNVLNTIKEDILEDNADLIAMDLKSAILAFEEISGEVFEDNILDNIFSNFCIGK